MTTLVTRSGKGSALSHAEMDSNWAIAVPATSTKTSAYTVVSGDDGDVLLCDTTSGAFTVSLTAAATLGDGFYVTIKKSDTSANAVTIDPDGTETIDGKSTIALYNYGDSVTIACDGSNWIVVASHEASVVLSEEVEAPENGTYTMLLYAPFDFTINYIKVKTSSGTCTVKMTIDGVDVTGLTSVAVSSTEASATASAANTVSYGNTVAFVVSSVSAATKMTLTVVGYK